MFRLLGHPDPRHKEEDYCSSSGNFSRLCLHLENLQFCLLLMDWTPVTPLSSPRVARNLYVVLMNIFFLLVPNKENRIRKGYETLMRDIKEKKK